MRVVPADEFSLFEQKSLFGLASHPAHVGDCVDGKGIENEI